ncbi:hypothetical protein C5167_039777 [Papaver somniferum]|uniref:Uncharacterized protein n=1 Tax=Papaver somniferum TaxID=3469 RepID=A0A4Y7IGJ2_PAPSO|nr:hypothetical protein C5167_039777 [Papaver somniferum]
MKRTKSVLITKMMSKLKLGDYVACDGVTVMVGVKIIRYIESHRFISRNRFHTLQSYINSLKCSTELKREVIIFPGIAEVALDRIGGSPVITESRDGNDREGGKCYSWNCCLSQNWSGCNCDPGRDYDLDKAEEN